MTQPPNPAEHIRLAYTVVNQFLSNRPWCKHLKEDLEGAALFGLTKACGTFRPDKGEWSHYATTVIKNQVITEVRLLSRATKLSRGTYQSLPKSIQVMTDPELENSRLEKANGPNPESIMAPQEAKILLKRLSRREKEIISLWFGIDEKRALSDGEIGRVVGLSRYSVWMVRTRAMSKLTEQATKTA